MADEQTELLRQILELQKQQFAFAKEQREEVMAIQRIAVSRQAKSLRMGQVAMLILLVAIGMLVALVLAGTAADKEGNRAVVNAPPD